MQDEEIHAAVRIGSVIKKRVRLKGAEASFTIGSSQRCDVFVDSDEVDVIHVTVTVDPEGKTLEIEDSTAGNGNAVTVNWVHVPGVYRCNVINDVTIRIGTSVSILLSRHSQRSLELVASAG